MTNHQLFVDDSGTREYADDRLYHRTGGKSRHFVYGGVLVEQRAASLLAANLQHLKRLTFGATNVDIKSNWLRMPDERRTKYLDPYGVTDAQLTSFTDGYYQIVVQAPVTLIAVVVDKLHMQERYAENAWHPPTIAYEVLLQRAVQAVAQTTNCS